MIFDFFVLILAIFLSSLYSSLLFLKGIINSIKEIYRLNAQIRIDNEEFTDLQSSSKFIHEIVNREQSIDEDVSIKQTDFKVIHNY